MSARGWQLVWGLIAVGTAVRLGLAFGYYGLPYDVDSFLIVRNAVDDSGFDMYGVVNAVQPVLRWPYPPGFIPGIFGADWLTGVTPLPFHGLIQLPAIAADAGLAWIVQAFLGRTGASERTRLGAAALVALGPVFILISGYHGQIDSLAILPAVAAVAVWERGRPRRAVGAGILLGIGAALKIVPGFALFALLPWARSPREALTLTAATIAIPAVMLLPFLIADPSGVRTLVEYQGAPGQGGLTLALQPGLAAFTLQEGGAFELNPPVELLYEHGYLNALIVVAAAAFILRFRPPPALGATLIFLALLSFGTGFFFHYLVWVLPFLIMAGYLRLAAAAQLLVLVPALLFYLGPWDGDGVLVVYVPLMLTLWIALLAGLLVAGRRAISDHATRV